MLGLHFLHVYRGGHIVMTILQNAVRRFQSSAPLGNPFPVESSFHLDRLPELSIAWSKTNYPSVLYKYYMFNLPYKLLHAIKHRVLNYSTAPKDYSTTVTKKSSRNHAKMPTESTPNGNFVLAMVILDPPHLPQTRCTDATRSDPKSRHANRHD